MPRPCLACQDAQLHKRRWCLFHTEKNRVKTQKNRYYNGDYKGGVPTLKRQREMIAQDEAYDAYQDQQITAFIRQSGFEPPAKRCDRWRLYMRLHPKWVELNNTTGEITFPQGEEFSA